MDREYGAAPPTSEKPLPPAIQSGWLTRCLSSLARRSFPPVKPFWPQWRLPRLLLKKQTPTRQLPPAPTLPWAIQYALTHQLFPDVTALADAVPIQRKNANPSLALIRLRAVLLGLKAFIEGVHPLDSAIRFYIEKAYLLNEPRSLFSPFGLFEAPTLLLTGGSLIEKSDNGNQLVQIQSTLYDIQAQWPDFVRLTPTGLHNSLIPLPYAYVATGKDRLEMEALHLPLLALGLQSANLQELAGGLLENCLHLIEQFGFVPAGNRGYLTHYSAPPFLTGLVKAALLHAAPHETQHPVTLSVKTSKALLRSYRLAKQEYYYYWMDKNGHFQESVGLNRYASSRYPESFPFYHTEPDVPLADPTHHGVERVGEMPDELYTREAVRNLYGAIESGWESSGRFYDRCNDFLAVDLNCLLYQYERDMAYFAGLLNLPNEAVRWQKVAEIRKKRIERFCWNDAHGLFYDFDLRQRQQYQYPTLAAYYPLFTGLATTAQARQLVKNLPMFEEEWGLTASGIDGSRALDAPFGTAPLHWVVLEGLKRYGYEQEAYRISQKWIALCTRNFEEHGRLFERYDVRSGKPVFHSNPDRERTGWTHAAYGLFLESFMGFRIVEPAPNVIYIGSRFKHDPSRT